MFEQQITWCEKVDIQFKVLYNVSKDYYYYYLNI